MERIEVTRTIAAPADRLYDMVSDLPRMGEWSPENRGGKWRGGATGPEVGARFRGHNRKGILRWSTNVTVGVADPGNEFAFDVRSAGLSVSRWGYRLKTVEGGTAVTEYWDDMRKPFVAKVAGWVMRVPDRAAYNRAGMEHTLEKLDSCACDDSATD
ncbi:MAG TPA: SRPBCC family protein [Ilumatobacteraceae bacterium]|nr:SRPBCC family protein [Ilumatobacteraceae bacterium]